MPTHPSDEALTELNAAVIRALSQVHDTFLQFLRRSLRSDSDAEDVMQEFYVRVVLHAAQLRKEESVQIWLRRLLRSALSDWRRRSAARLRTEADAARKEAATPPPVNDLARVVCLCLYEILPVLRPEYAELLRRADLENEPREAVATALRLTPGNLTVRLHRARQALRHALQLSCKTCPIHGYLDCGCEYTKRLRARHLGPSGPTGSAEV